MPFAGTSPLRSRTHGTLPGPGEEASGLDIVIDGDNYQM
jgi:hypothetical protein